MLLRSAPLASRNRHVLRRYLAKGAKGKRKRQNSPQTRKKTIDSALSNGAAEVRALDNKGRGVVALRPLGAGTLALAEEPFASHRGLITGVCNFCLKKLPVEQSRVHTCKHTGEEYCSAMCKNRAWTRFGRTLKAVPQATLQQRCAEYRIKFPLLALRMAASSLSRGFASYWEPVSALCAATVEGDHTDGIPQDWHEEYNLLAEAMREGVAGDIEAVLEQALDASWYARLMGRLHLNSFRVYSGTAADVQNANGSALYLLGSMFNHSCDPNVRVDFPHGDHRAHFVLTRAVEANEELCVSYIAAEQERMTAEQRQSALMFSHGFDCASSCSCGDRPLA